MPTIDVIRRLTVHGQTTGMDKVAADLAKVEAGQNAVVQSSARLVTATSTTERSVLGVSRQLDAYTRALDPVARAVAQVERGERLAAAARAQGVTLTDAQTRAMANASARVTELMRATESHTASMGLNRAASMQLRAATTSFFDQVQAGTPILTAARIQAGDFYEALASDKDGVAGGLRQVAGSFGRTAGLLLNPFVLATAGAVAFTAAAVLAVRAYDDLQRREAKALSGVGRVSGLSVGGLDALARGSAGQTGVGLSDSRSNAITLAGTGQLSAGNIGGVLGLTRGYTGAFGTSYAEAGAQLADIFSDPVAGAEKLNDRLGFLDDRTRRYIASLKAQGDQQGAVNALIAAAGPSLNEQVEKVGLLDRLWQRIKDNNERYSDLIGKAFQAATPRDTYVSASQSRSFLGAASIGMQRGYVDDGSTNAAEDMRNAARLRQQQQSDVLSARQSQVAAGIVRDILPDVDRFQSLVDRQKALQDALNNPSALDKMGVTADQAHEALDRLTTGLATFQTTADAVRQDSALTVQGIEATTFAGKLAADFQKTYAETLRSTHDRLEAAARAETQRNEAIATANKQAEDAARQTRNSDALLGLKPAQRIEAERRQALEDAQRSYGGNFSLPATGGTGGALGVAPSNIRAMIDDAAAKTDVDHRIIAAIGQIENGFKLTGGTSMLGSDGRPSSAWGYGQLTNGAAADVAKVIPGFSKYDPQTAVLGAATYFKILMDRNGGNMTAAANAYGGRSTYAADVMKRIPGALAAAPSNDNVPGVTANAYSTQVRSIEDHASAQNAYLAKQPFDEATDALSRQTAALEVQRKSFGATAEAIGTMSEKQNLLNALQENGIRNIDGPLMAQIDGMAAAYGRAAKAQDDLNKQQQRTIDTMDALRSGSKDALSTFVNDLRQGASLGKALGDVVSGIQTKILDLAENSLIDNLFGKSGSATGGLFGNGLSSLFSGIFHDGGIVGAGGAPSRFVPAAAFAGAPRYHSGYGLASDERPAILQTGEAVISRAALSAARNAKAANQNGPAVAAAPVVNLRIQHDGSPLAVNQRRNADGSFDIEAVVDRVADRVGTKIMKGNTSLNSALEQRYALNAARGNMR